MATKLQLVNKVLLRVREETVSSTQDNSYAKLVITFINEAKRIVEDKWDWLHLRSTVTVTTATGTFKYTLTGAGDRGRILPDLIKGPPWMDVFDDTNDAQLRLAPSAQWMTAQKLTGTVQTGTPTWFDVNGQSGGDPQVDLHPTPGGIYGINFNMCIPQADFSETSSSDDSTELTVPDAPVFLLATALAKDERGEDSSLYRAQFDQAFYAAVEKERELMQGGASFALII